MHIATGGCSSRSSRAIRTFFFEDGKDLLLHVLVLTLQNHEDFLFHLDVFLDEAFDATEGAAVSFLGLLLGPTLGHENEGCLESGYKAEKEVQEDEGKRIKCPG